MGSTIEVSMGEAVVSQNDQTTFVTFVGSCIALCMYDRSVKIGGMAHIMLPEGHDKTNMHRGKYANEAVENLLEVMTVRGAKHDRIKAKMIGGAKIFSTAERNGLFSIGMRNITAVRNTLQQKGIVLVAEETGMNHGRHVKFDIETGNILISGKKNAEMKL